MCGIIASASNYNSEPPDKEILWRDDNFTAYREKTYPVSSQGHIIIAFKYVMVQLGNYQDTY